MAFLGHASLQNNITCYFDFELHVSSAILRSTCKAQAKVPCLIKYAGNIKILRGVI